MKVAIWCAALVACAAPTTHETATAVTDLACREVTLGWGEAPGQLGLRPALPDTRARGPEADAVAPDGNVLVLDELNARVLAISPGGTTRVAITGIARDAEDLAVAADGAIAVFSPLQARTWMFEPDGSPAGTVGVDRTLRHLAGISVGPSRQIVARTAFQEMFDAGSPAAPVALATMIGGKREGAFELADGRTVAVTASGGHVQLLVRAATKDRQPIEATYVLPGRVDAASVVGVTGTVACVRAEQVDQQETLVVSRRAVCVDASTGRVVLDTPLAKPGLYVPHTELAVGGSPAVIAWMSPQPGGMTAHVCEVPR